VHRVDGAALIGRAVEFLADVPEFVWDGEELPVPIEAIADSHLGLLIREVDDMGSAPSLPAGASGMQISGLLLPALREIWVNAAEARRWPRRRRYTIAHELGHWVLHRSGGLAVRCRTGDVRPVPVLLRSERGGPHVASYDDGMPGRVQPEWVERHDAGPAADPIETKEDEANLFAGALLMPPRLMRRVYDECGGDVERVADTFQCSLSAVTPRQRALYEYGLA
jgi:hypothetical protein